MKIAGIYTISFTGSARIYIGSAMNVTRRKGQHLYLLRRNIHSNKKLQNYYNKYGELNFNFHVLECVLYKEDVRKREQLYLDQYYAQEYISSNFEDKRFDLMLLNISPQVGMEASNWTEERKEALRKRNREFVWTDEMKKVSSDRLKGTVQSEEIRNKKRDAMKSRFVSTKLIENRVCVHCGSYDVTKLGIRPNETKDILMQRLKCNTCRKGYSRQIETTGC